MKHRSNGRLAAAALAAVLLGAPAMAQDTTDTIMTDAGDLIVRPFHHASLMLTLNGRNILVDPAPAFGAEGDVTAEYMAAPAPDLILVTHEHPDHFNVEILQAVVGEAPIVAPQSVADLMPDALKAKATVMANGETKTIAGVAIEAVPAYNITEGRLQYHPEGRDNGYVLTLGGKRIYIAGDTEGTPEMRALENIDAAFVPMNLPYTMEIEQAADAVNDFRPAVVYPYHYGDSDVQAFAAMVEGDTEVRLLQWYPG